MKNIAAILLFGVFFSCSLLTQHVNATTDVDAGDADVDKRGGGHPMQFDNKRGGGRAAQFPDSWNIDKRGGGRAFGGNRYYSDFGHYKKRGGGRASAPWDRKKRPGARPYNSYRSNYSIYKRPGGGGLYNYDYYRGKRPGGRPFASYKRYPDFYYNF